MKTLAEICIAFTKQSPSLIPFFATIFSIFGVILMNARRVEV
jgi:hypothetical protein